MWIYSKSYPLFERFYTQFVDKAYVPFDFFSPFKRDRVG